MAGFAVADFVAVAVAGLVVPGFEASLVADFAASDPFVVVGRVLEVPEGGQAGVLVGGRVPAVRSGWDHFAG